MGSANARLADRVTGGELLRSLELSATAAESAEPSPGMLTAERRWTYGDGDYVRGESFVPALEQLQETAVEYVDILGVISQADSYKPTPGTPDTRLPRYRMDRTVTEVLSGSAVRGPRVAADTSPTAPEPPSELDRARVALSPRDWDETRRLRDV